VDSFVPSFDDFGIFLVYIEHANLNRMTQQATGTKLMGQPMGSLGQSMGQSLDRGMVPRTKKPLIQHVAAIADVFGDDRGLLKLLLTLTDEEIAGVQKFSQAYRDGSFPIDVMIDQKPQL
jgi:hypothetical protein